MLGMMALTVSPDECATNKTRKKLCTGKRLQPLDIQQQSKPCSAASAPSYLETHQRQQIKGSSKDLYYHWNTELLENWLENWFDYILQLN